MLVYTENCGKFKVENSWINNRDNADDLYAAIEEGKTYDFSTSGYNFNWSNYYSPNILDATYVSTDS